MKSWRCVVCGFIHEGDALPDECPVCGAPPSEFELFEDAAAPKPAAAPDRWVCLICGYEHEGPRPPDECPVCGVGSEDFAASTVEPPAPATTAAPVRIVIIGGGIAGVSAAEAARKQAPNAAITVISKEPDLPYYRINLSRYLAGEIGAEALTLHPETWYRDRSIELVRGVTATEIKTDAHVVLCSDGRKVTYDKLILATGANAFVPPIAGADKPGVFCLRTRAQADAILARVRSGTPVVCIGGGILGLEAAGALARRGAAVTVLEGFPWLMPRQLNRAAAEVLARFILGLGIALRTGVKIKAVTGDESATGVELDDGSLFKADLVLITAGVRSELTLAETSGMSVETIRRCDAVWPLVLHAPAQV